MLTTVEGVYRDGKIELVEKPAGVREARVIVTFLESGNGDKPQQGQMIYRGMFPQLRGLTDEDFRAAEWRGDDVED